MNLRHTILLCAPISLVSFGLTGCNTTGNTSATALADTGNTCPAAVRGDDHEQKDWERQLDERERHLNEREHHLDEREEELVELERRIHRQKDEAEERDEGHEMMEVIGHVIEEMNEEFGRAIEDLAHEGHDRFKMMGDHVRNGMKRMNEETNHRIEQMGEMFQRAMHEQGEGYSRNMHEMMERFRHEIEDRDRMIMEAHQRIDGLEERMGHDRGNQQGRREHDERMNAGGRENHEDRGDRGDRGDRSNAAFEFDVQVDSDDGRVMIMDGGLFSEGEIPEGIRAMVMNAIRSSMSEQGGVDGEEMIQVIMRAMDPTMEEHGDDEDTDQKKQRSRRGLKNKNNKKNPERK